MGRKPGQSQNGRITYDKASEIKRKYYTTKTSLRKLAKEYGVSHQTIFFIVNGCIWVRM